MARCLFVLLNVFLFLLDGIIGDGYGVVGLLDSIEYRWPGIDWSLNAIEKIKSLQFGLVDHLRCVG